MRLVAGTRGSVLALKQTHEVITALRQANPHLDVDVAIIKTKGDKILDVSLARIGDKGLFVKELETAILRHEVDFAVHSMKDLPVEMPDGLCIAAVPARIDASDVLITNGPGLSDLPSHARIGTSSLRRQAQLHAYRSDLSISDLRGNLDTRLRKLDEGEFDGIVLAYAGLYRMGWTDRITEKLSSEVCLSAVGQGALAIQARVDDHRVLEILKTLDDENSRRAVMAERSFLKALGGGCQVPIGAFAHISEGTLVLQGVVANPDGRFLIRGEVKGDANDFSGIGRKLAEHLLINGAANVLGVVSS